MDTCKWEFEIEEEWWGASCGHALMPSRCSTPKEVGFQVCPYCGRKIEWVEDEPEPIEPTDEQIDSCCLRIRPDFGSLDREHKHDLRTTAKEWLQAWLKVIGNPGDNEDAKKYRELMKSFARPDKMSTNETRPWDPWNVGQ
jgi:hypothetical protein